MAMKNLGKNTIIVASDIDEDSREDFRNFMLNQLHSKSRTESVYEFDYDTSDLEWEEIIEEIGEIVNKNKDTVYLWGIFESKDDYNLFREKVGK